MTKYLPAHILVLLFSTLLMSCGKKSGDTGNGPTTELGELPTRDLAKEAEVETQREAQLANRRTADAIRVEAIRKRMPEDSPAKNEKQWPLSVRFQTPQRAYQKITLSPDSSRVIGYEYDFNKKASDYYIFDLVTGKQVCKIEAVSEVLKNWVFSWDGTRIAAATGNTIRVWDTSNGQSVNRFPFNKMVWSIAYTPDGSGIFASIAGKLILIDADSGQIKRTYADESMHISNPNVSPSGLLLATSGGSLNEKIILWDIPTGRIIKKWPHKCFQPSVFNPSGWTLFIQSDNKVIIQDLEKDEHREFINTKGDPPAISPDGKLAAYTTFDGLVLRELQTGKEWTKKLPISGTVLGFFPGGEYVTTTENNTLHIWDVKSLMQ